MVPVNGDLVITANRPAVGAEVAVKGPTAKTNRFSGEWGEISGET